MSQKVFSKLNRNLNENVWPHISLIVEQIRLNGFAIIENILHQKKVSGVIHEVDELFDQEIENEGINNLKKINDLGVLRSPFLLSKKISDIIFSKIVLDINKAFFNDQFILHVNRAIINSKKFSHPATTWHREPPYQNFTTNEPIALTFVHFLDKNSEENGGLKILKASHKWPCFPSQDFVNRNQEIPEIKKGSLLVFDSALFHSASKNNSSTRRSLVTIFTSPLMKQQINLSKIINLDTKHSFLKKIKNIEFILGLTTNPFYSDKEYRLNKLLKKKLIG